ncbi:hypothetical protein [Serinicoccus hydrothermalis]|uniref:hypothetical protein n=1 Tax=Serinicoccus hydrothermalis TaxID=1758689 RepID=UPI0008299EC5|nr:hypothetical protein [Serinicoccus hydrothermalis]
MMWDFDSIYGKAKVYFARGAAHEHSDDEEFVLWHLLGFEFLLRAPLAKVHPSLLAAPEGESILAANGIPTSNESKSIPSHTVISRLMQIVPNFTKERQQDSVTLLNIRNVELHTGEAAAGNVANDFWLPKLLRVGEVVCAYLEANLQDVLDPEVIELARSLVDLEDKKLAHEVNQRIREAQAFFSKLTEEEIASRMPIAVASFARPPVRVVICPGCQHEVPIVMERVRASGERFVDDGLVRDAIYVAVAFHCPICTLELTSTAEIVAAGLRQQFVQEEWEDLTERFQQDVIDDDYGND